MEVNTGPKKVDEAAASSSPFARPCRARVIEEILTRGVEEVIEKKNLIKKLHSGKRLRIKYGADPSAPDLHLGHSACLLKLKEFQDLGHQIIFIIGDFTAMIGDPSKRLKTRPPLSKKEVERNAKTYFKQIGKILDIKKIKILRNSKWFSKMDLRDLLKLASKFMVARILERDDFSQRLKGGINIGAHEIIYPLMQAYDSIMVRADIELGGSDQKFNMLAGRGLQKKTGQTQQDLVIVPLLVGLDGQRKMSKTLGNYIGITEKPEEQYGKTMSIPDKLILDYFELTTQVPIEEIKKMREGLKKKKVNPRDLKARLAREIVSIYYGKKIAEKSEEEFNRIFKKRKLPTKIPKLSIKEKSLNILDLLVKTKLASSKAEAKRLVLQKGVKIDSQIQEDWRKVIKIKKGQVVQVGKRKFVKIRR